MTDDKLTDLKKHIEVIFEYTKCVDDIDNLKRCVDGSGTLFNWENAADICRVHVAYYSALKLIDELDL